MKCVYLGDIVKYAFLIKESAMLPIFYIFMRMTIQKN